MYCRYSEVPVFRQDPRTRAWHFPQTTPSQSPAHFCHCNVANYCLMYSRLKTPLYSGSITAFFGIIASPKTGLRQNWYNRALYGPGIFTPEDRGKKRILRGGGARVCH